MAVSARPGARRGPGSPPRPAHTGTAWAARRVAWLLRANRVLGPEERWLRATTFCAAFQGGCWPAPVPQSQLSRWETGRLRVPYLAIRRYEELLELPPGSLASVIDTINRYAAPPVGGPPALDRGWGRDKAQAIERVHHLLDRLTSGAIMTGAGWDELTAILSAIPEIVLVPSSTWTDLAGRLVSEMVISDGQAWQRRFESLNRLLGHPAGQRAAIDVCASLAGSRRSQIVLEVISALDGTGHPDASHHVLAQLRSPTSSAAFYGALIACIRKTRHGHMTAPQLRQLARITDGLLAGPARHDDAQAVAAQLLHQLPPPLRAGLSAGARRNLAASPGLTELATTGHLVTAAAPVVRDRILAEVMARLPREPPGPPDRMLPAVVDDLLFSPVLDTRLYTAMLLRATPYREPLATALGRELASSAGTGEVQLASSQLGALRILAYDGQRDIAERLVMAPGLPGPVAVSAAHALGHMPGHTTEEYWRRAVSHWGRRWASHHDPSSARVLHDLVYALGIANNTATLASIRDDAAAPPLARAAAVWWLGVPTQIRVSASR
jgi:hypothetical protein